MAEYYAKTSPEITPEEIAHMALSRRLAGECVVLLENDGTLPLRSKGKIALYGTGARQTIKGGTGSGDVNTRTYVTIEQGLKEAGFDITTTSWMNGYDAKCAQAKIDYGVWVKETAEKDGRPEFAVAFDHPMKPVEPQSVSKEDMKNSDTDTAVYVIARNSGEGADRFYAKGDYLLSDAEKDIITTLAAAYEKLIVVLNIGGVMDMTELKSVKGVNAVILMSQLGNIGGNVLADVLLGTVNPSGKLSDTWAADYKDYPSSEGFSHNDDNIDDEYYDDGIYVGYRYFDTFHVEPIYPFGYGKSYTDFELHTESVSIEGSNVQVVVSVKNTGNKYAGKEVVQVYVSAPDGHLEKPYQELKAFAKTDLLKPGESQLVALSYHIKDMASYCQDCASWVLEPGSYFVRVGNSSRHTEVAAELVLAQKVKTRQLKNLFELDADLAEITAVDVAKAETEHPAICLSINASAIETETAVYQTERKELVNERSEKLTMADVLSGNCTVEELVAQLTVEEMAQFCVGTMRMDDQSVVGNASQMVPGAAGDTTGILKEERGIKNMIFADGPAGLRIQPHFKVTPDGRLVPGGDVFGDSITPFDEELSKGATDYYQYCTAIPIGWALAQSWNMELLQQIGDMIGEEMESFGIDLWLAPALNIHRNPLCGRNFEYYSEDPLLSGRTAAAITRGVQKHQGKGTTIKHFAVNSQEDNRYFENNHVSERALREIYLKGFEITVKESQPLSIMTSYNLINGIHAANNHDLIQSVARDEWGFEGVVMTDWFTSQDVPIITGFGAKAYPISASTGCIYAGNDIQMPGCAKNVDDIVKAVKSGEPLDGYTITLADLQFNAANVIRIVAKTTK